MPAVTSAPTSTSDQISKFLWKTGEYALEGAVLAGIVTLGPHFVKSCLDPEQAQGFYLPVPDTHNAFAWTATVATIWPIARYAYQHGTSLHKNLSELPRKVGTYVYSLFPTKKHDVKKTTANLLYQNSFWGAACLSSLIGLYFGSSRMYTVAGIDSPIAPALTSIALTGLGAWWVEKTVREYGKNLVEAFESSEAFQSTCDLTQRGNDTISSEMKYYGIGLLVGASFPLQSAIASYLKKSTHVMGKAANTYPAQMLTKTAVTLTALFASTFRGMFAAASDVSEAVKEKYTTYAHPYVSESYNFTKTALFYSKIKELCTNGTSEVLSALQQDFDLQRSYEEEYNKFAALANDPQLDVASQQTAKAWLAAHNQDYWAQHDIFAKQAKDASLTNEVRQAAKDWLQAHPKSYETLYNTYSAQAQDSTLDRNTRIEAIKWLKDHPEDLTYRCPHVKPITDTVNYMTYITGIATAISNWSRLKDSCPEPLSPDTSPVINHYIQPELGEDPFLYSKEWQNYSALSQEDKDLCPYIQQISPRMRAIDGTFQKAGNIVNQGWDIVTDPTTQKVALVALGAAIGLYWVHAFGTRALSFLSQKKEETNTELKDLDASVEEETLEDHHEPSAPSLVDEAKDEIKEEVKNEEAAPSSPIVQEEIVNPPDILEPKEAQADIKPLAARTWTTKLSDALQRIAKQIQGAWSRFCSGCSYYFTQSLHHFEDLWTQLKRKVTSSKSPSKEEPLKFE